MYDLVKMALYTSRLAHIAMFILDIAVEHPKWAWFEPKGGVAKNLVRSFITCLSIRKFLVAPLFIFPVVYILVLV